MNDNLITTKLLTSIVSVEGIEDRATVSKFVNYMPAKDSRALRAFIQKNEPGVKMEVEFQCSACEYNDEVALPLGPEFFWPSTD